MSECTKYMFDKNGLSFEDMLKSRLSAQEGMEQLQHADVFHFEIIRQAPEFSIEKSILLSSMVTGVEVTTNGLNAEEVPVGSSFYSELKDVQSGEVQVTFLESQNGDVRDFLTKRVDTDLKSSSGFPDLQGALGIAKGVIGGINTYTSLNIPTAQLGNIGGLLGTFMQGSTARFREDIMPMDGTYLLPYDYYFSIKLSHMIRAGDETVEKIIVSGDFILDGGVNSSYTTGDEQYLTASATFKQIQGWDL